jgi:hypothetical protein
MNPCNAISSQPRLATFLYRGRYKPQFRGTRLSLAIAALLPWLAACGGGGGDPVEAPKAMVSSSQGDSSMYLGVWSGGCGLRAESINLRALSLNFQLKSRTANTVTGTLTTLDYGTTQFNCYGTYVASSTANVTMTIAADPVVVGGLLFQGTADKVTLSSPGQPDQTLYVGFESGSKSWQLSSDSPFGLMSTFRYAKF